MIIRETIKLEKKMEIKFVSSVLFVNDIQTSRGFYEEILGQKVLMDHGPNVGFEGGFALWQKDHANQVLFGRPFAGELPLGNNNLELYFETDKLEETISKLVSSNVEFVHSLIEQPWGQRVIRMYDPDRHIVEVGEPMSTVISRFIGLGMNLDEISKRTSMPIEIIQQLAK
jgi:catechol 2,3-dioxygenase-like lactoylglutathione lyase family enzyme